jgi:hypothetical protein
LAEPNGDPTLLPDRRKRVGLALVGRVKAQNANDAEPFFTDGGSALWCAPLLMTRNSSAPSLRSVVFPLSGS